MVKMGSPQVAEGGGLGGTGAGAGVELVVEHVRALPRRDPAMAGT